MGIALRDCALMETLLVDMIANIPNFAGFILLAVIMDRSNKRCNDANDRIITALLDVLEERSDDNP